MDLKPTEQAYQELQRAYDFFNKELFAGTLPNCLITMQRHAKTYGYFSPKRFSNRAGKLAIDEIAMNPDHFNERKLIDILSTLVHEMTHLNQEYFGSPGRKGYHNKEWAKMMEAIGLIPSSTGEIGGHKTGQHMSHYVEIGGKFEKSSKQLIDDGFDITWGDRFGKKAKAKKTAKKLVGRIKYTCPGCNLRAWAKPNVKLVCGNCLIHLEHEEA